MFYVTYFSLECGKELANINTVDSEQVAQSFVFYHGSFNYMSKTNKPSETDSTIVFPSAPSSLSL